MNNRRAKPDRVTKSPPLQTASGRPCAGRFDIARPARGPALAAGAARPGSVAVRGRPSHTKPRFRFVWPSSRSYKTQVVVWLGRLGCRSVGCLRCRRRRARAARCARPARRAPRPSGAAGALRRARALRWGTAGGVPPPAGGGGALRPRAFGAQATHADARFARDRSVRKIKNARIRKHVHKIAPCHFRGHALCWKLQGTPFPLQIARASCGSRIQEEPPNRAALSLS